MGIIDAPKPKRYVDVSGYMAKNWIGRPEIIFTALIVDLLRISPKPNHTR